LISLIKKDSITKRANLKSMATRPSCDCKRMG